LWNIENNKGARPPCYFQKHLLRKL
jgi:hypothetical protein